MRCYSLIQPHGSPVYMLRHMRALANDMHDGLRPSFWRCVSEFIDAGVVGVRVDEGAYSSTHS